MEGEQIESQLNCCTSLAGSSDDVNRISHNDDNEQNFMDNVDAAFIVLLHTFEYLTFNDLLRASMVSKLWNYVASHNLFWKRVKLDCKLVDSNVFVKKLKKHRTQVLDLEKMRFNHKPFEYFNYDHFWIELFRGLKNVKTLTKINVGLCPPDMITLMADAAPQLKSIGLTCYCIDFVSIGKLSSLTELNLRYRRKGIIIRYVEFMKSLKKLKSLSLRRVFYIDEVVDYLPSSLESLVLGTSTIMPSKFPRKILPILVNLKRLRVEKCQDGNIAIELMNAISVLPNLKTVELVNISIKEGFEDALAKCCNLKILFITPSYRKLYDSFTAHQIVIYGASKLKDTLDRFILCLDMDYVTTVENIFKDENTRIHYVGEGGLSIPFKTKVCNCESGWCNLLIHIDMISLKVIENEMLPKFLPRTKVEIIKVPYCDTWEQSLNECW